MGRKANPMTKEFLFNRCYVTKTGCWEWLGLITANGYGQVSFKNKRYRPHRVALHLWKKFKLNSKLFACHHCDNKLCCNPEHLFAGTHSDNMQDSLAKGRFRGGFIPGHKINLGKKRNNYKWYQGGK